MRADKDSCQHMSFRCQANVHRLSHDVGGPITGHSVEITIRCADCDLPFRFIGVAAGNDPFGPRVSIDGIELRAPLEPATHEKFTIPAGYTMPPRARQ